MMVVVECAALLVVSGSWVVAVTAASLSRRIPPNTDRSTAPTITTEAKAPAARLDQPTVGCCIVPPHEPFSEGTHDTRVMPDGRRSVRVTDAASEGPALCTLNVYGTLAPTVAEGGPLLLTERSALDAVGVLNVAK